MSRKYESDWVQPVLADIAAFLANNDMPEGLMAVLMAAEAIQREADRNNAPSCSSNSGNPVSGIVIKMNFAKTIHLEST